MRKHAAERDAQQFQSTRLWRKSPNKPGCWGELALADFYGALPDLRNRPAGDRNVDIEALLEIDGTRRFVPHDAKASEIPGHLLVEVEKLLPGHIYVLARGDDHGAVVLKWEWGHEMAKCPAKYWNDKPPLTYYKPSAQCRPLRDLIGMYCWQWRHHGLDPFDADWWGVGLKPPEWMALNPPPDLHEFLRAHGGYASIPPKAWAQFDTQMKDWQNRRRVALQSGGKN